ncbi:MAG: hypothetical protein H7A36_06630 [Chlamydiales bacterium]|nr:hypothetical protein [Chlamydiales bacterium]
MALGKKVLAVGAIVAFSFAVFAASQHPDAPTSMMNGKNGSSMNGSKALKVDSIDVMKGKILSVTRVSEPDGTKIHVVLETDKGDKTFILGPASYLDRSRISLQMGDRVTLSGYEVNVNGEQMWVGTKIEKGSSVVHLRGKNGEPNWKSDREGNPRMSH